MTKRTILAFALSVVFFVAYQWLIIPHFVKPPEVKPAEGEAVPEAQALSTDSSLAEGAPEAGKTPELAEAPAVAPEEQFAVPEGYRPENVGEKEVEAETDLLKVVFTTKGGALKEVTLKRFDNFERNGKLVLLRDFTTGQYPLDITRVDGKETAGTPYLLEADESDGEKGERRVTFSTVLHSGAKVTKVYTLRTGKYGIELEVRWENLSKGEREFRYEITGAAGVPAESYGGEGRNVLAVMASVDEASGKMSLATPPSWDLLAKGDLEKPVGSRLNYAGAMNQYFAAVLRPAPDVPVEKAACFAVEDSAKAKELSGAFGGKSPREAVKGLPPKQSAEALRPVVFMAGSRLTVGECKLGAGGTAEALLTHSYVLYCGPREKDALSGFDMAGALTGFSALQDYGWLEWFVKAILYLMQAFHAVIPNWGVAIVLLTFLIRLLMHPLTKKSQVSMSKMQRLQPEIQKLQEKYKNDKQKLGSEQMKLMKEKGASPLGGCLPMLIQLPVFFALYKALMVSIELRQSPFVWWIKDLAQPDRLFVLPFTLPVVSNEVNLIPLLMLGAMVWQQKMTPKPPTTDAAAQQRIMSVIMPVFIGFLLYRVAAGLNLYIFTSTVFGIVEQKIIKRHIELTGKP